MKRKVITYILATIFALVANAQQCVDTDAIKSFVTQSPVEYKALVDRFIQADTTLSLEELSIVYYGAPFCKDFEIGKYDANLEELYNSAQSEEEYDVVYIVAEKAMKGNPVSFDLIVKSIVAAKNSTDDRAKSQIDNLRTRYAMIYNVIASSGDGVTPNSPCYVISQSDKLKYLAHAFGVIEILEECEIQGCEAAKVNYLSDENVKEAIVYVKIIK